MYLPKTPPKFELKGHKANITALAFHPSYTQVATTSEDGTIKIWEFETGDFERTLKGHTSNQLYMQIPSIMLHSISRASIWPVAARTSLSSYGT